MKRSLWPREHGAYFQLAIPLVTACVVRAPTIASLSLAAGASLAFLANEPLLVVLGHRGVRRKTVDGDRARARLAILAGAALVLGILGLVAAPRALLASAIVGAPVLALLAFAWKRAEHTLAGELVAAVALTGASVPAFVAAGGSLQRAIELWLAWAVGFGASVLAVHRVMARHKRRATWIDAACAFAMLALGAIAAVVAVRALPLIALSTILVIAPPSATHLRAIGIAIVVAAIATALL